MSSMNKGLLSVKELREVDGFTRKAMNKRLNVIEKTIKEQENIIKIFKNALTIGYRPPKVVSIECDDKDMMGYAIETIAEVQQQQVNDKVRKALREWVIKNSIPSELKIILNKRVDVNDLLGYVDLKSYNEYVIACDDTKERVLTENEYNLVVEMYNRYKSRR